MAKSEQVKRRQLDEVSCASTAARDALHAEVCQLRRERRARALKTTVLQVWTQLELAFVHWGAEVRGLQARRHLEQALEEADLRHARALAVHRAQARETR